jgi:hypothetical protein
MSIKMELNVYITDQYFHHHAKSITASHPDFVEKLTRALSNPITIEHNPELKEKKDTKRISAGPLNKALRELLSHELPEIRTEVFEVDGVYYEGEATHGFDFAFIDEEHNLLTLRNLCFGNRPYKDGDARWDKYISDNPKISELARVYSATAKNINIDQEKNKPIILGEIQFGNWGLVYRDFFKVIKANLYTNVDLLVYITAKGDSQRMLSDGIVGFKKTKEFLIENTKVVTIPTWLIAIDISESTNSP